MIRQIEIQDGEARRTAALMSVIVILVLALSGVWIMHGLAAPSL
jgi:hypothetical protein